MAQVAKFLSLYVAIACLYGLVLYSRTDRGDGDYRMSFPIANAFNMVLSLIDRKLLVFKK
jgi:hypothetical protein